MARPASRRPSGLGSVNELQDVASMTPKPKPSALESEAAKRKPVSPAKAGKHNLSKAIPLEPKKANSLAATYTNRLKGRLKLGSNTNDVAIVQRLLSKALQNPDKVMFREKLSDGRIITVTNLNALSKKNGDAARALSSFQKAVSKAGEDSKLAPLKKHIVNVKRDSDDGPAVIMTEPLDQWPPDIQEMLNNPKALELDGTEDEQTKALKQALKDFQIYLNALNKVKKNTPLTDTSDMEPEIELGSVTKTAKTKTDVSVEDESVQDTHRKPNPHAEAETEL